MPDAESLRGLQGIVHGFPRGGRLLPGLWKVVTRKDPQSQAFTSRQPTTNGNGISWISILHAALSWIASLRPRSRNVMAKPRTKISDASRLTVIWIASGPRWGPR